MSSLFQYDRLQLIDVISVSVRSTTTDVISVSVRSTTTDVISVSVRSTTTDVISVSVRRLQLGLVAAVRVAELPEGEAARHDDQRTACLPYWRMVRMHNSEVGKMRPSTVPLIHLGGALILDRCRAFYLFSSVDAHLCMQYSLAF
jgi:hypothetical protein